MLYTHTHTSAALVHPSSGLNRNGAPPLRVAAYEALYYYIFTTLPVGTYRAFGNAVFFLCD